MEVAAAVREMVAATAMPLDLQRGALLEQGLALQQQLAAARAAVSAEQQVQGHSWEYFLACRREWDHCCSKSLQNLF